MCRVHILHWTSQLMSESNMQLEKSISCSAKQQNACKLSFIHVQLMAQEENMHVRNTAAQYLTSKVLVKVRRLLSTVEVMVIDISRQG